MNVNVPVFFLLSYTIIKSGNGCKSQLINCDQPLERKLCDGLSKEFREQNPFED